VEEPQNQLAAAEEPRTLPVGTAVLRAQQGSADEVQADTSAADTSAEAAVEQEVELPVEADSTAVELPAAANLHSAVEE